MKKSLLTLLILALVLAGCAATTTSEEVKTLAVGESTYTVEQLQALPQMEASYNDVGYVGVTLNVLLTDAGIDPGSLAAVKVTASDGYTVNYEADTFMRDDVIVAYAQAGGRPLTDDDGVFRMVVPDAEGKLNIRQVVSIEAVE